MTFNFLKAAAVAAVTMIGLQAAPAFAIAPSRINTPSGSVHHSLPAGMYLPPAGMLIFCRGHSSQCQASSVASVAMTEQLAATLNSVNTRVNRAITPRNDVGADVWSVNVSSGDCEDYVLTKRAALIRSGVPSGALRIAATTYRGEGHAILVVKTSAGDYVLDNMNPQVRKLNATGYHIKMIATADPKLWTLG